MSRERPNYNPSNELVNHTRETLERANPLLRPDQLAQCIPAFAAFGPYRKMTGIWRRLDYHIHHAQLIGEKLSGTDFQAGLVNFAGIFAGGKNTLANVINQRKPNFWNFALSATSRDIRTDEAGVPTEADGEDYHFRNGPWFAQQRAAGTLINYVRIGANVGDPPEQGTWYAFPKVSLEDAWSKLPLAYVHITIDTWKEFRNSVQAMFAERNPLFLSFHLWPELHFQDYLQHLKIERPNDYERRSHAAVRELIYAANQAQVIVVNRFGNGPEAEVYKQTRAAAIADLITEHFVHFLNLPDSAGGWIDKPTMSPGIGSKPDVLLAHHLHERAMAKKD